MNLEKRLCRTVRILSLGCGLSMLAAPVLAESCLTRDSLEGPGIVLETDAGVVFSYRRDGETLYMAIHEDGIENAAPVLQLDHHGLLAAGWDRTAIGEGRIAHVYEPDQSDLPPPGPGVVIRTTRTSLPVMIDDTYSDVPISVEDVAFRFGTLDTFEFGSCAYRGLSLETETSLKSSGEPIRLSGIWLSELEIFIIKRILVKGSIGQPRTITGFRARK